VVEFTGVTEKLSQSLSQQRHCTITSNLAQHICVAVQGYRTDGGCPLPHGALCLLVIGVFRFDALQVLPRGAASSKAVQELRRTRLTWLGI